MRGAKRVCVVSRDVVKVLHNLVGKVEQFKLNEYLVKTYSDRYENFYYNGFVCASCGLEATYGAIEKNTNGNRLLYHVNFYGTDDREKEVLFTKDHIYPRSLGGFNNINNYQPMCERCNHKKQSVTNLTPEEAVSKGYTSYERIELFNTYKKEQEKLEQYKSMVLAQETKVAELKKKVKSTMNDGVKDRYY